MADVGDYWFFSGQTLNKWIETYQIRIAALEQFLKESPDNWKYARRFFGSKTASAFDEALATGNIENQRTLIITEINRLKEKLHRLIAIKSFLQAQQQALISEK